MPASAYEYSVVVPSGLSENSYAVLLEGRPMKQQTKSI